MVTTRKTRTHDLDYDIKYPHRRKSERLQDQQRATKQGEKVNNRYEARVCHKHSQVLREQAGTTRSDDSSETSGGSAQYNIL